MKAGFIATRMERFLGWARASSLWYLAIRTGCCADELLETVGCRYDLERFGCLPVEDPAQADLLIVTGLITRKAAPEIRQVYEAMLSPKYVLAVGACACSGGAFKGPPADTTIEGLHQILPVDVYVPGCPPRPEAIMNGLIALQEKIKGGNRRVQASH
ncbi:MAG TPA: NADH-quinone oxidoreductase subunit NuoB [Bdellovibrionota bacterium]|jgi:NADH-quinone oxidoreductase subunit B|nr:NADH-quinone oxidoreductase subunit NuoB [Bdellovibrionota bacterium]